MRLPKDDPQAARDFKAIRVPFNRHEHAQLERLAELTGRTKLNAMRWAMLKMAEVEIEKAAAVDRFGREAP